MSKERTRTNFYGIGGTWRERMLADGSLSGVGFLGDQQIEDQEKRLGLDKAVKRGASTREINLLEREMASWLLAQYLLVEPEDMDRNQPFRDWCPEFHQNVYGHIFPIANFDSSHARKSFMAATAYYLTQKLIAQPNSSHLAATGTDTADRSFPIVKDAQIFDTYLPDLVISASGDPFWEAGSDAPLNFRNLSRLAQIDVRWYLNQRFGFNGAGSQVFWSYHNHLFSVADLVKFNPIELRRMEGYSTFMSPNNLSVPLGLIIEKDYLKGEGNWQEKCLIPPDFHPTRRYSMLDLYDALTKVYIADLSNQNSIGVDVKQILSEEHQAIVVAGHGLGNTNNPIRWACIEAAKWGKIVVDVSHCLVGGVSDRYAASLVHNDGQPGELKGTDRFIINGQGLNKIAAMAITARCLMERRDQFQSQGLVSEYHDARYPGMHPEQMRKQIGAVEAYKAEFGVEV